MVRFTRSARMVSGKEQEAMQWAKEFTEWSNAKYGGQLTAYLGYFGDYGTVRWVRDFENLADLEKGMEKLLGDQEYWQRHNRAVDLFIEGSLTDTVMASL